MKRTVFVLLALVLAAAAGHAETTKVTTTSEKETPYKYVVAQYEREPNDCTRGKRQLFVVTNSHTKRSIRVTVRATYQLGEEYQAPELHTVVVFPETRWALGCDDPGSSYQNFEHVVASISFEEPEEET